MFRYERRLFDFDLVLYKTGYSEKRTFEELRQIVRTIDLTKENAPEGISIYPEKTPEEKRKIQNGIILRQNQEFLSEYNAKRRECDEIIQREKDKEVPDEAALRRCYGEADSIEAKYRKQLFGEESGV